ncbi:MULTISPECIES: methylglyoxal synthase [Turicibacter]|uniref:Methylglyoxal synthase n=2 Tax=Turicibacter sanguinis TaxID=154288 RepID=A0A173SNM1_9FIRM|nr:MULTISPECIES: methylglyoxal synthase [Turicibacter]EFF62865.1 methylglyoxal synthase [Turicibacter sanguinis PC909]EGC92790.1 methylglyoxal synthase [Turicibacter sp. HGF1]MBP3903677.1 methylglyoxal synthase [Turicibacter sp.]MCU7190158.1 methylglyoxal synthase [Turicibacter sanguinis]MCU7196053.1 methylglyoxal synthase [Turicibacter sanguinis]
MTMKLNVALIAHDRMKDQMVNFCYAYEHILENYGLYATGTTGGRIEAGTNLKVNKLASGPLGGDQQIGSLIVTEAIDLVIFLRDPLTPQPHETDIQALIRLCDVHYVPIATNLASAEIFVKALNQGDLDWRTLRKIHGS